MSLWPFTPVGDVIEALEWRTDVLRARASEQRFRLRDRPRRSWHFNHIFDSSAQSAARALLRGATAFHVPDWIIQVYSGYVSSGSAISVTTNTSGLGLVAGQSVVLWNGILDYEICTIQSVSSGALVLVSVNTARNAVIYRVDRAHAAVELSISRPAGPLQSGSISFEAPAVDIYSASTYAQYRNSDVLPIIPVPGNGLMNEGLAWPMVKFDNETGLFATSSPRDLIDDSFTMRWHAFDSASIKELRDWISSRCGRWLAFWQSTWENDLTVAADIGSSSITLRVFAPDGASMLGRSAFDLEIVGPSALYLRRISAVSAGPAVSGRPTFDLTMDSSFGTEISAVSFIRISYLRCARFNADRIELLHRPGEGLAVTIPCIEVPVP